MVNTMAFGPSLAHPLGIHDFLRSWTLNSWGRTCFMGPCAQEPSLAEFLGLQLLGKNVFFLGLPDFLGFTLLNMRFGPIHSLEPQEVSVFIFVPGRFALERPRLEALEVLRDLRAKGGSVNVSCQMGKNRSAAAVLAPRSKIEAVGSVASAARPEPQVFFRAKGGRCGGKGRLTMANQRLAARVINFEPPI